MEQDFTQKTKRIRTARQPKIRFFRHTSRISREMQEEKPKKSFISRLISLAAAKKGSDPWVTVCMLGLMAFGTLMVISTELGMTVGEPRQLVIAIIKQVFFMCAGYGLMVFVSKIFDMKRFETWYWLILLIFFSGMVMVLFFGTTVYGSKAWITVGNFFSIQPSEFAKPLMIAICGASLYQARFHPNLKKSYFTLFRNPILFLLGTAFFVFLQHDLGTMVIIFLIFVVCTLVPNEKGKKYAALRKAQNWIKALGLIIVVGGFFTVFATDIAENVTGSIPATYHVSTRIRNMKNPYSDIYNEGYQPANSLYSIGDAGIFGKGLGNSARKYGYLTQAESDYILAVTIEETGLLGLGLITALYVALIGRLFWYAMKTQWTDNKVILCGAAAYFGLHFIINVGGVGALIPMTGVPLLFISSGGSSVLAASMALGLAQNRISKIRNDLRREQQMKV